MGMTSREHQGAYDAATVRAMIAGGMRVDFKAGRGGKVRADGTRAASMARADIDQLLGYALMDYSDTFALHTVAVYAVRFGYLGAWPITELGTRMAGRAANLARLREEFAKVLRGPLPRYLAQRGR
ncbi:MAG: hypothetical protein QOE61_4604 [Micromonosporaceae bacterium]|jgi:hypothetical protein|nr:hypothetical protein [Actinoplanes sp.]MDT5028178.1 hypothetical protein [Micromonosporaceae bacterium]